MTAPRMTLRPFFSVTGLETHVVHHHAPVVEQVGNVLAVEPPHRRRIGPDGQADVLHLARAVDDGHGPEDHAVGRLVQAVGEAKQLDVEVAGIERVPSEFLAGHGHLVAAVRNDGELVREILRVERLPHIGSGENGIGAVRLVDRLEKQPALQEAVGVRRFGLGSCLCKVRRQCAGRSGRGGTFGCGNGCLRCTKCRKRE